MDKDGKPFWYGIVVGAQPYFIWMDIKTKDWGAVMSDGGEANKGYYEVFTDIANGYFQAQKSGSGGGGGGGLVQ